MAGSSGNEEFLLKTKYTKFVLTNQWFGLVVSEEKIQKDSANQKQELPMGGHVFSQIETK